MFINMYVCMYINFYVCVPMRMAAVFLMLQFSSPNAFNTSAFI